jgi:RND family efflux transporter MFP subunit
VITKRYVEPFFEVKRGDPIFDVFIEAAMDVATSIPETDIEGIHLGQSCEIVFPIDPDTTFRGIVTEIGRMAEAANAFPVKVHILTNDPRFRPGMTAELSFKVSEADFQKAFLVPIAALVPGAEANQGYVFVYDQTTSTVQRKSVRGVGAVVDNRVMIIDGLEDGDIIAVAGVSFLEDGQKVKLMSPEETEQQ